MAIPLMVPRVPPLFRCPISLELMRDPVTLSTGQTYDRSSIEKWFESGHKSCPATMQHVNTVELIPNHTLRRLIQDWCVANRSKGVERIPTPKQPVDHQQVSEILRQMTKNSSKPLKNLRLAAKESEKNRRCIAEAGAVTVLCSLMSSSDSSLEEMDFCEDAVCILRLLLPLQTEEVKAAMATTPSLLSVLAWVLNRSSCEGKINAAYVIESLAVNDEVKLQLGATQGLITGLVKLLKEDLYQRAVKASLAALLSLVACKKNRPTVAENGAVAPLIELLPHSGIHDMERALGVLENLAKCVEGRARMLDHSLCIPMLVRMVLTVSDIATERAVDVLWIMCHSDEAVVKVAAQEGAFTQMLLLLQADNTLNTSQRARELLKLLKPAVSPDCFQEFAFTMPF